MITLLESSVKIGMTIYEARTLCKILGSCSPAQLHESGLTLGEIETYNDIYLAIKAYLQGSSEGSGR